MITIRIFWCLLATIRIHGHAGNIKGETKLIKVGFMNICQISRSRNRIACKICEWPPANYKCITHTLTTPLHYAIDLALVSNQFTIARCFYNRQTKWSRNTTHTQEYVNFAKLIYSEWECLLSIFLIRIMLSPHSVYSVFLSEFTASSELVPSQLKRFQLFVRVKLHDGERKRERGDELFWKTD